MWEVGLCVERTREDRDLFTAVKKRIMSISFSKGCEHTCWLSYELWRVWAPFQPVCCGDTLSHSYVTLALWKHMSLHRERLHLAVRVKLCSTEHFTPGSCLSQQSVQMVPILWFRCRMGQITVVTAFSEILSRSVRMAIIKKRNNGRCWPECAESGTPIHCWWDCQLT